MVRVIHKKKTFRKLLRSFKKLDRQSKFSIFITLILLIVTFISFILVRQTQDLRLRAQSTNSGQFRIPQLSIMLAHWETNNSGDDLNKDNIVNVIDLSILLSELD